MYRRLWEWYQRDVLRTEFTVDPSRFDSITRRLSEALDRRTLSKSVLAALGTTVLGKSDAAAQTPCTHKLDCAVNEICSGQSTGTCTTCDPDLTACPYMRSESCTAPFNSREHCPFWICVDLSADPANCGECDRACASGNCVAGNCGSAASNAGSTNASGSISLILADDDGAPTPYEVSIDWSPVLVTMPNGDAWGFFTAQLDEPSASGSFRILSDRKVFAAKYDATLRAWQPGTALYGEVAFGATATIDQVGRLHLAYSERFSLDPSAMSTLFSLTLDETGAWSAPQPVDLNAAAGHQLSADLTVDQSGQLHIAWQDQRGVSDSARNADPSNADIFVSDLDSNGVWGDPVQVSVRSSDRSNASRPLLAADGDRLIAVWSEYDTAIGLETATAVLWSWRPIANPLGWSTPLPVFDRGSDLIGGRFLDLAAIPTGGVGLVYGRRTANENMLYLQQLDAGTDAWSQPVLLASGDRGSYPRIAYAADGTLYVVYNLGSGIYVEVGGFSVGPGLSYFGLESNVTAGEEGIQGIASVAVDSNERPWVIYFHQPMQEPVMQARVLTNAAL
jgi:hypothetical protein